VAAAKKGNSERQIAKALRISRGAVNTIPA
jgi:hypothetical protein